MSEPVFFAQLPLPPSANHLYPTSGSRRVRSHRYKAWAKEAGYDLLAAITKAKVQYGTLPQPPYSLEIRLYFGNRRRRDASNFVKAIEDQVAEVLHYDDKLNYDVTVKKRLDTERPRVEVLLKHLPHVDLYGGTSR